MKYVSMINLEASGSGAGEDTPQVPVYLFKTRQEKTMALFKTLIHFLPARNFI